MIIKSEEGDNLKIRHDFVTNSSSSSFIISKKKLRDKQIEAIKNYEMLADMLNLPNVDYADWVITDNDDYISGFAYIDNFDFDNFLNIICVNPNVVEWGEFSFDVDTYEPSKDFDNEDGNEALWEKYLDILLGRDEDDD